MVTISGTFKIFSRVIRQLQVIVKIRNSYISIFLTQILVNISK